MGEFNFKYVGDSVKKIRCNYSLEGKVNDKTCWEGYILTTNIDGVLKIEGFERDKMDSPEADGKPHTRYILGEKAISMAKGTLRFTIYPSRIRPILYDLKYNDESKCFNGTWRFAAKTEKHNRPSSCSGEAIIRIEETDYSIADAKEILKKIGPAYKKEYSEEMENINTLWQRVEEYESDEHAKCITLNINNK